MDFSLDKLNGFHLKAEAVPVPEWGADMVAYVAELSADERDERIETWWPARRKERGRGDNVGLRAFGVAATLCDSSRNFLAADEDAVNELANKLSTQSAAPMSRLFEHACTLNCLIQKDVEELEKN